MSTEPVHERLPQQPSPLRRLLWDGVLPEALGLCFVAIIFAGFGAAYLTADYAWNRQSAAARQSGAAALTEALALALGPVAESDREGVGRRLKELGQVTGVRSLRWTAPDGKAECFWPPAAIEAVGSLTPASATDGRAVTAATAVVRTAGGEPAGVLRVEVSASGGAEHPASLLWSWGIAATVTLLVFVVVYHRLRRHLRPVAAIERNLQSYADGIEKDLAALTLSDSLGNIARSWNLLIEQLTQWQRQSQEARQAGQAESVLSRFESAAFRRVVDRLPFGVLCVGPDQHINYANSSSAALLGRAAEGLVGVAVSEAIENPAVAQGVLGVQTRAGAGSSVDHTRREGDQETTLRFRIVPMTDQPGTGGVLITVEDIGQLKEDQRARDNFLYHVTHELRTPLTSIHAYAETLTKPGFDDEQTRKECYNVIISETRRLSNLVENILSISQLEVGTARLDVGEVDLVRLMRQMVQDNLGAADEKHIDLTLSLPPKVPKIRGDKQRLAVLLTNLIGNAIKYTAEQGEVHVVLEVTEQGIRIAVADTGIGIAPEDQPHVFEKFYRAADQAVQMVTGTGLGLAIAHEVARLHGGDIELESEKGKGSKFTVVLPAYGGEPTEVTAR